MRMEYKDMCEVLICALDNKRLFLKDPRLDKIQEEDLNMHFYEFINALFIVGSIYHQRLTLYKDFSEQEALDDFLHHSLKRFNIDTETIFRKRIKSMFKLKF